MKTEGKIRKGVERCGEMWRECEVRVSFQMHVLVSLLQEFRCPDCGNFFLSLGLSGFEITKLCPGNLMLSAHRNPCIPDYVGHESMRA